jgi:hypothetical protein
LTGFRETWTEDDWRVEFDERVGIKMDSHIEEKVAEDQARKELAPLYRRWKNGSTPRVTGRGRKPKDGGAE